MSQTTLSGTLTQLPQLCQLSWSRCPCSKANPTAAVVLSSPGQGFTALPGYRQFQTRPTTCPLSLWPLLEEKAKQMYAVLSQNSRLQTQGQPDCCRNTHLHQHRPQDAFLVPCSPCMPSLSHSHELQNRTSRTSSPEGTVRTCTAQCCLSSPASWPFYSTINTGWRRNR